MSGPINIAIYPYPAIYQNSAVADQRLTVDNTAGGVQFSAFNDRTNLVVLDIQVADVFCTFDGSAPVASPANGHRLLQGSTFTWSKATALAAKFIRATATNGEIQASEFQM